MAAQNSSRLFLQFEDLHTPPPRVLFDHIPKTGGTTLSDAAKRTHISFNTTSFLEYDQTIRLLDLLADEDLPLYITGHNARSVLLNGLKSGPYGVLTFLREPYSRFLSQYKSKHRLRLIPQDMTPAGYLDRYRHNIFTSWLGEGDFERAVVELETRYSFFGIMERYAESLSAICQIFGFRVSHCMVRNINPMLIVEDTELRTAFQKRNQEDCELYARAAALFDDRIRALAPAPLPTAASMTYAPEIPDQPAGITAAGKRTYDSLGTNARMLWNALHLPEAPDLDRFYRLALRLNPECMEEAVGHFTATGNPQAARDLLETVLGRIPALPGFRSQRKRLETLRAGLPQLPAARPGRNATPELGFFDRIGVQRVANEAICRGMPDLAVRIAEAFLDPDPLYHTGSALGLAAQIHDLVGRKVRAAELFAQAREASPDDVPLKVAYARFLAMDGRHAQALNVLDGADDGLLTYDVLTVRAEALAALGRDAEAEDCLRRCVALRPANLRATQALAVWLRNHGRVEQALEMLDQAVPDLNEIPLKAREVSVTLCLAGEYEKAMQALRAIPAELVPDPPLQRRPLSQALDPAKPCLVIQTGPILALYALQRVLAKHGGFSYEILAPDPDHPYYLQTDGLAVHALGRGRFAYRTHCPGIPEDLLARDWGGIVVLMASNDLRGYSDILRLAREFRPPGVFGYSLEQVQRIDLAESLLLLDGPPNQ